MTTIHCYTGSQPTVDRPGPSFERSRAAAVSMVPTTTSAAHQITQVLPELKGRLSVAALRVPCISVSAIDVVLQVVNGSAEEFGRFLKQAFAASQLVGLCNDPCVSSDFRGRLKSVVISLTETQSIGDGKFVFWDGMTMNGDFRRVCWIWRPGSLREVFDQEPKVDKNDTQQNVARQAALDYHEFPKPGKLEIRPTKPMATPRDLARAYSRGMKPVLKLPLILRQQRAIQQNVTLSR